MKKIEKIISHLEGVKEKSPYIFEVWGMQNMLDLSKSCLKGDISHKTTRKLIFEQCTDHLDTGCYDSAHAHISLMCLPFVWK